MEPKILGPFGGTQNGAGDMLAGALIGSLANGNRCYNGNCGNGFFGGNGGFGDILAFFLGAMMNNGWNGGGLFGGGNNQNAQLAQDFLAQAIDNNGQRQQDAIANLSTLLGTNFDQVNTTFMSVKDQLAAMASNIQLGQCETRSSIERTGTAVVNANNQGVRELTALMNQQFSQKQMADCQRERNVIDAINANGRAAIDKMDAIEDARKDREIAELQRKLSACENEKFIANYVSQAIAPVIGGLNAVSKQVSDICCKMPQTVTLPYSGLTVVPNWQAQIGYDIAGSAIANRFFPSPAATTTTTTPAA